MNRTITHARWRVLPVQLVAKLFGMLIKVEGMPFGSSRVHLANPPRREDVAGGQFPASVNVHIDQAVEAQLKSTGRLAALRPGLKRVNRPYRIRL